MDSFTLYDYNSSSKRRRELPEGSNERLIFIECA